MAVGDRANVAVGVNVSVAVGVMEVPKFTIFGALIKIISSCEDAPNDDTSN